MVQKKTACNRDCPDGCGLIATVDDGRIVRLAGDPDHPVTQGFLCHRTSQFLKRQYSPQRITQPMIRQNKNQAGDRWETVSLDSALDLVADRMNYFRDQLGPASILNYRCGGSMGMMKYVTDFFFQEFGPVTIKSGDICAGAGDWAQAIDFGTQDSNDFFDLLNSKTVFLWGKNVYVSHVHLLPILKQAKSRGVQLVLIDPVHHRTAALADEFFQIQPGADGPLALGMARWMLDRERLDPAAANYCDQWDGYCDLLKSRTVNQWAALADMAPKTLEHLAELYSDGPTTILAGWGMQRRRNGAASIRAIDALGAASGNIGIPGGGVSFYFPRKGAYQLDFLDPGSAPRAIPEPLLGSGIEAACDPPIEMVFVTAANPVTNIPDSKTVQRALNDRFTVVVDMFMTDTAKCADVFLPAASMLEDDDLLGAYGHHYLNTMQPVIDPPGDAQTDYEILRQLAPRVGLGQPFTDDVSQWKRKLTRRLAASGISLEQLEAGQTRNPFAAQVAFAGRHFPTTTGRANLLTDYQHPPTCVTREFPLRLMALSTAQAQASQWPSEKQQGPAVLTVHPSVAGNYQEGDVVEIESELGRLEVGLKFDSSQRADVALMDKGGWVSQGRCANLITPAELTDHGQCAVYYETPVKIL
ncbi:MAG: molybdopterin-dependent oxidoreductase [Mariniblastus sp.]|nr:molybdopterin-dependent oxidoreductase [Mariniblastus sp.]